MSDKDKDQNPITWKIRDMEGKSELFIMNADGNISLPKGTYTITVQDIKLPSRHILVKLEPIVIVT